MKSQSEARAFKRAATVEAIRDQIKAGLLLVLCVANVSLFFSHVVHWGWLRLPG